MGNLKFRENWGVFKRADATQEFHLKGAEVTATAAELNAAGTMSAQTNEVAALVGVATDAVIVVGAEVPNTINVTIQLNDADGVALATRASVMAYLSDDAAGDSIAATAPDGGVAIGTDGLAIPLVAGKALQLVSEADGDIDLDIIESGVATWYLIVVLPDGLLVPSAAITFA